MKYYIEETEKNIELIYKSICPIKKVNKNDKELYRHVKQVICHHSATLYVDDVQLYKKAGGKVGDNTFGERSYLPTTWEGLSGITERLPHDTYSPLFPNVGDDRCRSHKIIINKSECGDILTITSEDVDYAASKDGLTQVATLYRDYQKSWWIDIPREESEKIYEDNMLIFLNTFRGKLSYPHRRDTIDSFIHFGEGDAGLVRLAKMTDYVILSELIYRHEKNEEKIIPYTEILSKRSGLYYFHGIPDTYGDASDFYFKPHRWIFEANYDSKNAMERIVKRAESLKETKDKDYAKAKFKQLMSEWKELGVETDQSLWDRMVTVMNMINQK